jgi:trigger factor
VLVEHGLVDGVQVPGASEVFTGKVKGATVELEATLPAHFKPTEHAGKDATIRFTISRHRLAVLPELDDPEFLKRLGVESVDDLRQRVRQGIESQRSQARTELVDKALERYLLERHEFELPERLLSKAIDRRVHEIAHQMMERQGLSAEDGHHKAEEKRAEVTSASREGLRLAFVLDRIARAHELRAGLQQAEDQVRALALEQQADPEALVAASRKEGWLGDVQEQLTRQAARGWLRERADVTEKEPEAAAAVAGSASEAAGSAGGEGSS